MTKRKESKEKSLFILYACIIGAVIMLALTTGTTLYLRSVGLEMDKGKLATWAALATILSPLSICLGIAGGIAAGSQIHRFIERGIDLGLGKVSQAGSEAINLRGQAAAMHRAATADAPDPATLRALDQLIVKPGQGALPAETLTVPRPRSREDEPIDI